MAYVSSQQAILMALRADVGSYSYQVVARTGLERRLVSRKLSRMVINGEIGRMDDERGAYQYYLKSEDQALTHHLQKATTLDTQNIAAMWHRLSMLKRMREKIIEDFHPLLDAVIKDYETFLHREEGGEWLRD